MVVAFGLLAHGFGFDALGFGLVFAEFVISFVASSYCFYY